MMKIERICFHRLEQKLRDPLSWSGGRNQERLHTTVVEIHSDTGHVGWADGWCPIELIQQRPELLLGRSPFEVMAVFDELGGLGRDAGCMGTLDVALWDLAGRILEQPVFRMLGNVQRHRVLAYASVGYRKSWWDDPARCVAEEVGRYVDLGFKAIKIKAGYGVETDAAMVEAARRSVGQKTALCLDTGYPGCYDLGTAMQLGRLLEPFRLTFWEEPLLHTDLDGYRRLREHLNIPLAGGECVVLDELLDKYIGRRLVDIVQPDIERVGFTGGRFVSWCAWLNHMRVIPHTWAHTPLRIMATLHWLAVIPVSHPAIQYPPPVMLELHPPQESVAWDLCEETISVDPDDGCIEVPQRAGLGLTVIPERLNAYRVGPVVEVS